MKVRIKFDNPRIKVGLDGKIEGYDNKDNPGEAAFYEVDMDFLYMAYKMFPPYLPGYNNIGNLIQTYLSPYKQAKQSTSDISGYMLANGHDIYNYVARYGAANFQIQVIMEMDGRLDQSKLLNALRLSIEATPVFGCKLVENDPPYWKPVENIDYATFCSFEMTDNPQEAIWRFLESPLDMDRDPMIKLRLISSGPYDTLCLKINHTCCDGTGAKEYLKLLSNIYSHIENNEVFTPKPGIRSRRDQDRLFDALGIKDPESAWTSELEAPKNLWEFPFQKSKPRNARVAVGKLPSGYIDVMSRYGKAKGATINDILLTAFYRAMFEMSNPEYGVPMDLSLTADLRQYLPDKKTEAIRCFSGGFDTRLARISGESFPGTLSRVMSMMKKVKKGHPGLQSAVGLERVERAKFFETLSYYQAASQLLGTIDKCTPILSNLGFIDIDKSTFKFGKNTVTDAYFVPPAISAPGLLLCVGTYNSALTMAISYYESQVRGDIIERVLYLIKKEIIEGCNG